MEHQNQEQKDVTRRKWTREETQGFLECYLARKSEFKQRKKKRLAYSHVLEDMISKGITNSEKTPICLESKMRTLLHAYKLACIRNRQTGTNSCYAPFTEKIEEIFGRNSIISNDHTVRSGSTPVSIKSSTVPSQSSAPSSHITSFSETSRSPSPSPSSTQLSPPPPLHPKPSLLQLSPSPASKQKFKINVKKSEMKKMKNLKIEHQNQEQKDVKRRMWTREETEGFLECYLARKSEFEQPKKKRLAYSHVLEDMISKGITDSERTPICLEAKVRTLLNAYKSACDNNRRTEAPFMEKIEEIFGRNPIISNGHAVDSDSTPVRIKSSSVTPPPTHITSLSQTSPSPSPSPSSTQLSPPPPLHPKPSLLQSPPSPPSLSNIEINVKKSEMKNLKMEHENQEQTDAERRKWVRDEAEGLLECYLARKSELVSMMSMGITDFAGTPSINDTGHSGSTPVIIKSSPSPSPSQLSTPPPSLSNIEINVKESETKYLKMEHENQEQKDGRKRIWTREETERFLECYLARKSEFENPKNKRLAYSHVLEDMISKGITISERTPLCLEAKMQSLLNAYKDAYSNKNRQTGTNLYVAPFAEKLEEIFGRNSIISNNNTGRSDSTPVSIKSSKPCSARKQTGLPKKCCVCYDEGGLNIILHKFPREKAFERRWRVALNLPPGVDTRSMRVCCKHFKPTDFQPGKRCRGFLLAQAVPRLGIQQNQRTAEPPSVRITLETTQNNEEPKPNVQLKMEKESDLTVISIDSEASDLEDHIALNQIKRELQLEESSPIESVTMPTMQDAGGNPPEGLIASNAHVVDEFIIYELDAVDNAKADNQSATKKVCRHRESTPNLSKSNIAQRPYRLKPPTRKNLSSTKTSTTAAQQDIHVKRSVQAKPHPSSSNEELLTQKSTNRPSPSPSPSTVILNNSIDKFKVATQKVNDKLCEVETEVVPINTTALVTKCPCYEKSWKEIANTHTQLELKDFFERMYEETRKLSIERRQMIKTALLKAVCKAENDVADGMLCASCYFLSAQSNQPRNDATSPVASQANETGDLLNSAEKEMPNRKKFNDQWLEDPVLKGWLANVRNYQYKCQCIVCNKFLPCNKYELQKHAALYTHRRRFENFKKMKAKRNNVSKEYKGGHILNPLPPFQT